MVTVALLGGNPEFHIIQMPAQDGTIQQVKVMVPQESESQAAPLEETPSPEPPAEGTLEPTPEEVPAPPSDPVVDPAPAAPQIVVPQHLGSESAPIEHPMPNYIGEAPTPINYPAAVCSPSNACASYGTCQTGCGAYGMAPGICNNQGCQSQACNSQGCQDRGLCLFGKRSNRCQQCEHCEDCEDCEPNCWDRHLMNYCMGPGDLHGHYPYYPEYHGYYYFRPYNYEHVLQASAFAAQIGGDPTAPYSVEFLKDAFPLASPEPLPLRNNSTKPQLPLLEDLLMPKSEKPNTKSDKKN